MNRLALSEYKNTPTYVGYLRKMSLSHKYFGMVRVSDTKARHCCFQMENNHHHHHHQHHPMKPSMLSFKNATIVVCFFNIIAVSYLLYGFFDAFPNRSLSRNQSDLAQLRYEMESEEIRLSMVPLELIKRVKEIEQEASGEPGTEQQMVPKQTAAVDLSKRLKDFRAMNDEKSQKALEEWRKRKMERARQREIEKNGTNTG